MSKAQRYKWREIGHEGEFQKIPKHLLLVDDEYQRGGNQEKATRIAATFDWRCFGVAIVARRPDGRFMVIDGQHRVLAAMRRIEVTTIPCMVFPMEEQQQEADVFLRANKNRKPLSAIDQFKALVKTNDRRAMVADELMRSINREPSDNTGASSVRCVASLISQIGQDEARMRRLWPLLAELCADGPFLQLLLEGLFYLEGQMPEGVSLTDPRWRRRCIEIGATELVNSAKEAAAYYKKGGAAVWASGIAKAINHGLRHRLPIQSSEPGA